MTEKFKKGHVTIGVNTPKETKLEVLNFFNTKWSDNRLISIIEDEQNCFTLSIENPTSSGRNPVNTMRLSKESFVGLISTALLYMGRRDISLSDEVNSLNKNCIEYFDSEEILNDETSLN